MPGDLFLLHVIFAMTFQLGYNQLRLKLMDVCSLVLIESFATEKGGHNQQKPFFSRTFPELISDRLRRNGQECFRRHYVGAVQ